MFQKDEYTDRFTQSKRDSYQESESSIRSRVTAMLIREEAAESLLSEVYEYAEFVALVDVLNRYDAHWWLAHLSRVGADPQWYWRQQLGEEIKAAMRDKSTLPQSEESRWWLFHRVPPQGKYELTDLKLNPL